MAAKDHKRVILVFGANWCYDCHVLDMAFHRPDFAPARVNLGNALAQSGRFAEAIAEYETALRGWPDDAEAHFNLGNALLQTGRSAEAIAQYREALRIKPDFRPAQESLQGLQPGEGAEAHP